ncbi:hypothetical protein HAX54_012250 [Datura stramonium]|uniref:Uncharacterized protein n=1 Tax=Datura stramonium TaxID=4076 RepID=A0ABS8TJG0_DATST|nr:hypothetical protein [Datura stramonium]
MKATWGETSYEESEVEDGDNENLVFMAKSDTDSDNDSSEVSLSDLKSQIHNLSKRKVVKLLLSLMDECQQMSVEKMEMSKIFSNLKSNYKVLKKEKIESENTIETLNAGINNLEKTVSVQKTENKKRGMHTWHHGNIAKAPHRFLLIIMSTSPTSHLDGPPPDTSFTLPPPDPTDSTLP